MTLPSSGSISLRDIANEYGATGTVSLRDFLGKPGVPSSGNLSITNFYGKSNITFSPPPGTLGRVGTVTIGASQNVGWNWTTSGPALPNRTQGQVAPNITFNNSSGDTALITLTSTAGGTWNITLASDGGGGGPLT